MATSTLIIAATVPAKRISYRPADVVQAFRRQGHDIAEIASLIFMGETKTAPSVRGLLEMLRRIRLDTGFNFKVSEISGLCQIFKGNAIDLRKEPS